MKMRELSNDQRKAYIDSSQVFESWREAVERLSEYRHGMVWKASGGHEYLFRLSGTRGYGKSLGKRTPETEQVMAGFKAARFAAREHVARLRARLDAFAKVNKAFRVGRVPNLVGKIIRKLDLLGLLGSDIMVLGTHCLFAYEAAAGVQIDPELTASGDVDLLVDTRKQLSLVVAPKFKNVDGLLGMLRSIDRSFRPLRSGSTRAINSTEFMVDLLAPAPTLKTRQSLQLGKDDLTGIEIEGLQWLLNAPKFETIAIDQNGWPLRLVVPDPRAFAAHKLWVAEQADRSRLKSPRDRDQARLVLKLVEQYFPHLPLSDQSLMMFPASVRNLRDAESLDILR
jgi:hypothetical protein